MGRYTTVQAYADNNQNMRSVSYEQASASASSGAAPGAVRPEKVNNPYGSTAGAGSGEFHVYRHARSREMARVKKLDEEEEQRKLDAEFRQKFAKDKEEEERRTEKRRKKRLREKEAKRRRKNMKLGGVGGNVVEENARADEEEFSYVPVHARTEHSDAAKPERVDSPVNSTEATGKAKDPKEEEDPSNVPFANDGSFLEMMKRKLEAANGHAEEKEPEGTSTSTEEEKKESCGGS